MTTTPEMIQAAKSNYEAAQAAQAIAATSVASLKASHGPTTKAFEEAKKAYDALKPAMLVARAMLQKAEADVTISRSVYHAAAPKELTAENAAKKGTGNAALLVAVKAFLATKPEGATNTEIYEALLAASVEMAGADPKANLASYLSRWGTAGSIVSKGVGSWGVAAVAPAFAPPAFAPPAFVPPAAPIEGPFPSFTDAFAPSFGAPVEVAPVTDSLLADFPGYEPLVAAGYTTKTSLNGATAEQLVTIPGVGAKTADKIIAALAV
jgi:hypothetical protein